MTCERYTLDKNNKPVEALDLLAWGEWMQNMDNRRVAWDNVGDYSVSTVFLGLDHRFVGKGDPVLWETMIFNKGKRSELYMRRYTSYEEAVKGHATAIEVAKVGKFE